VLATWSSSCTSLGGTLRENIDPAVVFNSDGRLDAFVMEPTGPTNQRPTADAKSVTTSQGQKACSIIPPTNMHVPIWRTHCRYRKQMKRGYINCTINETGKEFRSI